MTKGTSVGAITGPAKARQNRAPVTRDDAGTAVAIDHGAGQRHGGYGTGGNGQERQAKYAGAHVEPFLGQGNVRDPRAHHDSVQQKEGERGPACLGRRIGFHGDSRFFEPE